MWQQVNLTQVGSEIVMPNSEYRDNVGARREVSEHLELPSYEGFNNEVCVIWNIDPVVLASLALKYIRI